MSAPGKGKGSKPSPAVASATPASSCPDTTPVGSGIERSPPEQTTPAPTPEVPKQDKPVSINSDPTEENRDDGADGGAEAES